MISVTCLGKLLRASQFVQHDAGRMEEDGSPLSNRIGGVEDAHRVLFRADYLIGRGRAIPNHHGTAIGEEREVRIPRRRPRFPPARSRWKGGVSSHSPCKNIINCDYLNEATLQVAFTRFIQETRSSNTCSSLNCCSDFWSVHLLHNMCRESLFILLPLLCR